VHPQPSADWKPRELEILALLAEGLSDRAIATRLHLAPETVRWYNKQIYARLGVSGRARAVRRAASLGLLDVPSPASTPATIAAPAPAAARAVSRSPIRWVSSEGVHVAYQTVGEGPVDLLLIHGFLSHLEVAWEEPEFASFFERLGRVARVILFDKRGVGLSDRAHVSTLEDSIADALLVLDAVGSKRAVVMGTSEGGAASVLLASMHPERVSGLILFGATPKVVRSDADSEWAVPAEEFERRVHGLQATWGEPWALERFAPTRMHEPAFRDWWSRIMRAASSPAAVRTVMENASRVDIRALLPEIRTRTLVAHRAEDGVVPCGAGRYLARHLPNARWLELPGPGHIYFVESATLLREVTRFLQAPAETPEPETWIAVLLCATGAGARFPAEKRTVVDGFHPRRVQATRRGWLALFDSPARALQCARALREAAGGRGAGMALHVGACPVGEAGAAGPAHEAVQRLADGAAPGEILVSGTLRDIVAGMMDGLEPRLVPGEQSGEAALAAWRLSA
jgi:pimeloyl-ACP methyl ester carboxylesterase/DNA-binding CsgD family transcriptional regulator